MMCSENRLGFESSLDFEVVELTAGIGSDQVDIVNIFLKPQFNFSQKIIERVGSTFGNQSHATIGQVLHVAGNREKLGDRRNRISKADALNMAPIMQRPSFESRRRHFETAGLRAWCRYRFPEESV